METARTPPRSVAGYGPLLRSGPAHVFKTSISAVNAASVIPSTGMRAGAAIHGTTAALLHLADIIARTNTTV
jgi:hypothetical protein